MSYTNPFIVFEGLNGCGKDTQMARVVDRLQQYNREGNIILTLTREPNRIDQSGTLARDALDGLDETEQGRALMQHMSGNRGTHTRLLIRPNLEIPGVWVLSSRYYHSTFGFQGAQGVSLDEIRDAQVRNKAIVPDLTLIYDVTSEEAALRLNRDGSRGHRRKFDSKIAFNHKVRDIYLSLPERLAGWDDNIRIIDGMQSRRSVERRTWECIEDRFGHLL